MTATSSPARDLAAALVASAREVEARAMELVDRVRESDSIARAQARGVEAAERARERAEDVAERAGDLAERARERGAEAAAEAAAAAREGGDLALGRVGNWLVDSGAAERLGVQRKRRSGPGRLLVLVVLGLGIGYAIARLTSRNRQTIDEDDFAVAAERIAAAPSTAGPLGTSVSRADPLLPGTGLADQAMISDPLGVTLDEGSEPLLEPALGKPLVERVRARLDADPRTTALGDLAVNVADATVFIRGRVPLETDRDAVREVVAEVPGVADVDLEVTTRA